MSYALLQQAPSTPIHWVSTEFLGRYQRVSNAVRARAFQVLADMLDVAAPSFFLAVTFDNAPGSITMAGPTEPISAFTIGCAVSVRWNDTALRGTPNREGEFPYRFSGVLEIAFLSPRRFGDGMVTEAIEFVADDLRWESSGEVRYGIPQVLQGAPGIGEASRYARTVAIPFYIDEDNDALRGLVGGALTADTDAVTEVCRTRFRDEVGTPNGIVAVYDNSPTDAALAVPHVRLDVLFAESELASLGGASSRFRGIGLLQATISIAAHIGDATALAIADLFFDAFHDVNDRGVLFHAPSIRTSGRSGSRWQIVLDVPFRADIQQ